MSDDETQGIGHNGEARPAHPDSDLSSGEPPATAVPAARPAADEVVRGDIVTDEVARDEVAPDWVPTDGVAPDGDATTVVATPPAAPAGTGAEQNPWSPGPDIPGAQPSWGGTSGERPQQPYPPAHPYAVTPGYPARYAAAPPAYAAVPPYGPGTAYPQQPPYGATQPYGSAVGGFDAPPPYRPELPGGPVGGSGGTARGRGRLGRGIATTLLALLLAGGGGVIGGLIVHATDQNAVTTATSSSTGQPAAAAPTIDRSSLADIVARVQPAVVSIKTETGEGSGVVLSADGYVLTNNHVVATAQGGAITVSFTSGKTVNASIVGTDPKSDLAVVKAQGASGLATAKLGDSSAMRVGDSVFAIGSPLGLEGSVTAGIISATDRTIQESSDQQSPFGGSSGGSGTSISGLLQTDAAINPGNSGGALVNLSGEVIGINTAIATSGQSEGNIGVGFAIPSNRAKQVSDQLIKGQKVSHPLLGVAVTDSTNGDGAVVSQVTANGPAAKAGIRVGDVITKLGGQAVASSDDLISAVQAQSPGAKVAVTLQRNGAQRTVTVTIGES